MATTSLPGYFNLQLFTSAGELGASYRIYTYAAGTTTHKTAYTESTGTTAHTYTNDGLGGQYIACDARGELPAPLWLTSGGYDIVAKTPAGVTVWTRRAVGINDPAADVQTTILADLADATAAAKGAGLVGFDPLRAYGSETVGWGIKGHGVLLNHYDNIDTTGATNCGSAIQTIINANKGKRIMFGPGTYLVSGIELDGSTYDGTVLECLPGAELKLDADNGDDTFGGAWVGILIKDCARVQLLNLRWDGNRANMTAREQIFCIAVAGATDYDIIGSRFREVRGDGIYIAQSDWSTGSATPKRGTILDCKGYNSAVDGRNLISVISAEGLQIHGVYSDQIGGIINATTMPAGICIEPDQGYHTCADIQVADALIISAGTSGMAVLGKAITDDATRDWNSNRISVKDVQVKLVTGATQGPAFTRCSNLQLDVKVEQVSGSRVKGIVIDAVDDVTGEVVCSGNNYGVNVGAGVLCKDIDLRVTVSNYSASGLRTGKITGAKFTGRIYGAQSAVSTFAIQCHNEGGSSTQTDVTYSVDCPYDGNNVRAFRNEVGNEVTFSDSKIMGCDFGGYASISVTCDAVIPAIGVFGLDLGPNGITFADGDTTPSVGIEAAEYVFSNSAPTSVTMFDGGREGREILVRMNTNTTIVHNASNIYCKGAGNIASRTTVDFVRFRNKAGVWYEQSRSW